jgi:integrase/recombinase XerD
MKKELKELFGDYIHECRFTTRRRPTTIKGYQEVFRHFSNLMPEVNYPSALTTDRMNEFFVRLQKRERVVGRGEIRKGVKDSTVKTYWSRLFSFFEWLKEREIIEKNPLKGITPPQPKYDDHRALRKKEIDRILSAITQHSKNSLIMKRDMLIVHILLFAGLRRGEISQLQVRDIDMERGILTVRPETSKSRRLRQIAINKTLYLHLDDYLRERKAHGYKTEYLIVSSTTDQGLTEHGFKHWVKRIERQSGVKFHLHRFRHTFAISLVNSGVNVVKIQRLMGHTDIRMTQRYLRSMGVEDMREDVDRLTLDNLP